MNVASLLADPAYPRLKDYILDHTGLAYYADKDEDLATRLCRRLVARPAADCSSYLRLLLSEPAGRAEMDCLVGELTIGETYFFRQKEHFELLRDTVFPDLLERNGASRTLRIWSAGCATGAEPYSISLLLHREFQSRITDWAVSILATDINREFLDRAREARFAAWALRETPREIRDSCFISEGKQWLLRPEYRSGVTFQYHNLAGERGPADDGLPFDLIMCRNVIIYFSRSRTQDVVAQFHRCLTPGGWLLVGHAEPNLELFQSFETVSRLNATAYRKATGAGHSGGAWTVPSSPQWQPLPDDWMIETKVERAREITVKTPAVPNRGRDAAPSAPPGVDDARTLADKGHWKEAIEATGKLIAANPLDAPAHFTMGLILEHAGAAGEARTAFRRAIYLDRGFALAHYHLGTCLQSRSDPDAARKNFENVLQLLSATPGNEVLPHGDGITADELRDLARMHLDLHPAAVRK